MSKGKLEDGFRRLSDDFMKRWQRRGEETKRYFNLMYNIGQVTRVIADFRSMRGDFVADKVLLSAIERAHEAVEYCSQFQKKYFKGERYEGERDALGHAAYLFNQECLKIPGINVDEVAL